MCSFSLDIFPWFKERQIKQTILEGESPTLNLYLLICSYRWIKFNASSGFTRSTFKSISYNDCRFVCWGLSTPLMQQPPPPPIPPKQRPGSNHPPWSITRFDIHIYINNIYTYIYMYKASNWLQNQMYIARWEN